MRKIHIFCTLAYMLIGTSSYTQYSTLLNFEAATNGSNPMGSLISDGTFLYGMTSSGGTTNDGTIFKIMPDGTGYVKLLDFAGATNGSNPKGDLIFDGTFLYGMTKEGGTNDIGTIFKIMPNGTGYVKLLDFAGVTNGKYPFGSLISDGTFLYGTTQQGGTNNLGTIFKIMPDGAGYVKILDFAGVTNGSIPMGSLISDGTFLYGMTRSGGTTNDGTIFKIMPNGNGYVKLLNFAGITNGRAPRGSLFSDGTFLYGMTRQGGTNDFGTIFKIMPDGTGYIKLLDFAGITNGRNPNGSLISDGTFLYGMTAGGSNNDGTIFKITPNGTGYLKLLDFAGATNGEYPYGSLISDGTFIYGMTYGGGTNDFGTTFKIMPNGTGYVKLLDFAGAINGKHPRGSLISDGTFLYGMTREGGTTNDGTIFKIMPDGTGYVKLFDFAGATNGRNPHGSLISDGTFLYGMTYGGGTNDFGTIFKIMPDGTGYVKLLDFEGTTNGRNPNGSLIFDGTFLYGMTAGGTNNFGTIFKIMPNGTGYVPLLNFNGGNGYNPYGSLIYDGTFLYGMTSFGGTSDLGTIFKIMPNGTGYVKLLNFNGGNGSYPNGSLISDGTFLYGMTSNGGTNDLGTIFKIMPNGTGYLKLLNFAVSTNGYFPYGSLISDGTFLYGMTSYGGANNLGAIFKIMPNGTDFVKLLDFAGSTNGSYPIGDLIIDGTFLYGMTYGGGTSDAGVVFKYCIPPLATATNTGAYCEGTTIQLNSTGGDSYLWSGPLSYTNAIQNPTIASSTTDMSGTYTVTVTNAAGCTSSTTTVVTVDVFPAPTATNTGEYCQGVSIQLNTTGGNGDSYLWSGPLSYTNATQNPTIASSTTDMSGTYIVTVTNSCGTSSTSTVVTVDSCLGMEKINLNAITIYPNPTTGIINISASFNGEQFVSITNILGEVGLSKEINLVADSPFTIDITDKPAGIYFLRIGNSIERIIKQ